MHSDLLVMQKPIINVVNIEGDRRRMMIIFESSILRLFHHDDDVIRSALQIARELFKHT